MPLSIRLRHIEKDLGFESEAGKFNLHPLNELNLEKPHSANT